MHDLNGIYELYDSYIKTTEDLRKNSKVTAGLLGLTKGPKDDPCHDRFAEELEAKIKEFASSDPDPDDVYTLLVFIYSEPLKHRSDNMVYWMFTAVHSLCFDLIKDLRKEDAEKLYRQYVKDYPKWERLPAQKKTIKALKDMM